jgi:hypothetical protein
MLSIVFTSRQLVVDLDAFLIELGQYLHRDKQPKTKCDWGALTEESHELLFNYLSE